MPHGSAGLPTELTSEFFALQGFGDGMAKLENRTPVNDEEMLQFLQTQDDFSFELEIYSEAEKLGLSPRHAWTYEDPVTNKPRQFDIRAQCTLGPCTIRLAIECKRLSPLSPLLVSRVPRIDAESFHSVIVTPAYATGTIYVGDPTIGAAIARTPSGQHSIYKPGESVGKSMRQLVRNQHGTLDHKKTKDGDEIFDKWMQALASSAELLDDALAVHRARRNTPICTCVLPILVVPDHTLWAADYLATGAIARGPAEITDATFFVGRKYHVARGMEFTITHLHVITRGVVPRFLTSVSTDGAEWRSLFQQALLD